MRVGMLKQREVERVLSESDLIGTWMLRPAGVVALQTDIIRSGVPRFRLSRGGAASVRSLPVAFRSPDSTTTIDGKGSWEIKRTEAVATVVLRYGDHNQEHRLAFEIVVSQNGDIDLVSWLVEPGEGALTFERVSAD